MLGIFVWLVVCLFFFPLNYLHPIQLWLWEDLHGTFAKLKNKNARIINFQILGECLGYPNVDNLVLLNSVEKKFLVKPKASCCSAATHLPGCGDNMVFPPVLQIF